MQAVVRGVVGAKPFRAAGLAIAGLVLWPAGAALAACAPPAAANSPAPGTIVTCPAGSTTTDANSPNGYGDGTQNGLTINVGTNAVVEGTAANPDAGDGMRLGSGNTINNDGTIRETHTVVFPGNGGHGLGGSGIESAGSLTIVNNGAIAAPADLDSTTILQQTDPNALVNITNNANGTISGQNTISANNLTLNNFGIVTGAIFGVGANGTLITNQTTGQILSPASGGNALIAPATGGTINNSGLISDSNSGFSAIGFGGIDATLSIHNTGGTIEETGAAAAISNISDNVGDGSGNSFFITNSGTISATTNYAINSTNRRIFDFSTNPATPVDTDAGHLSVVNSTTGVIRSTGRTAVLSFGTGSVLHLNNTGLITGVIGVDSGQRPSEADAISEQTSAAATIFNGGTITGTGGTAIHFGGIGGNTLTLAPSSIINGNVLGTGTDIFQLGDLGTGHFNMNLVGAGKQYSGFSIFNKIDAGTWIITHPGNQSWGVTGGTLQVGDGTDVPPNETTSGSFAVSQGATLAFEYANPLIVSGVISGAGSVHILSGGGGASAAFTGTNTYAGGTTIDAGAQLALGDNTTTGSIVGNVVDNGRLDFARTNAVTLAGDISGAGGVNIFGNGGPVTFSGHNTYADTTFVNAATVFSPSGTGANLAMLVAGATNSFSPNSALTLTGAAAEDTATVDLNGFDQTVAGLSGSIGAAVRLTNGAILTLGGNNNNTSFNGHITGTGGLTKVGTGLFNITAGNGLHDFDPYTGPTHIMAGTIRTPSGSLVLAPHSAFTIDAGANLDLAGSTQTIGSLAGAGNVLLGAGTLNVGDLNSALFSGVISGTGGIEKTGLGTLKLGGINTYSGPTVIEGGHLNVNGSIIDSLVSVHSGGFLGGNGTTGGVTVQSGGTIAPGNSIDTLTVASASFAAGSFLETEIAPGSADLLRVTGTATIDGGALVHVLPAAGTYTPGDEFLILDAGTRSGGFGGIVENSPFVDFSLDQSRDPNQVWLRIAGLTALPTTAQTPNQIAASGAIQTLGSGNAVFDAIIPLSAPASRAAFDQASGEVHASATTALLDDSSIPRDAALDAVEADFAALAGTGDHQGAGRHVWGRAVGEIGTIAGDGNAAAIQQQTGGLMVGADGLLTPDLALGVEAGLTRSAISVPDRNATATATGYSLGVYGATQAGMVRLRFGAAASAESLDTRRTPAFGAFTDSLTSSYWGTTAQVFADAGYEFELDSVTLEPFVRLALVHHTASDFAEAGGADALHGTVNAADAALATIGIRPSKTINLPGGQVVTAEGLIGWQQAFGATPTTTESFASGSPFTIAGPPLGSALALGAKVGFAVNPTTSLSLKYDGLLSVGGSRSTASATLSGQF